MSALEQSPLSDPARLQALHGHMVEALLDGGGLYAVATLAAQAAGGRVVIALARDGLGASAPAGARSATTPLLRIPIASGGDAVGTVSLHADGPLTALSPDAPDALHAAAMATLTYVALMRDDPGPAVDPGTRLVEAILDGASNAGPRARAIGVEGAAGLSVRLPSQGAGTLLAALADAAPGIARAVRGGWIHALVRADQDAVALAAALHERHGVAAAAAPGAPDPRVALREARLAAQLVCDSAATPRVVARGIWRLLVRDAVRERADVEAVAGALGALADSDAGSAAAEQLRTLAAYIANNCNMNATAGALPAHRHTIAYRLERVRDATGLDPLVAEDREQLGVALKARAVLRAAAHVTPT